jgi:1-deoxy-D-xylulose-5-phosphate reductoisomerase
MNANRKSVTILGATGSVGKSTLDLILRAPDSFDVLALTAKSDVEGLAQAARAANAKRAVIADEAKAKALASALNGSGIETAAGEDAVIETARMAADWTMAAIVGCAGLRPVMAALEGGKTLAFANKEALVSAGSLMMDAARRSGATLLPVDSEHNAVFQCLDRSAPKSVARIILTASGGPFRCAAARDMARATPEQAVAHPNWSMGAKISVDSATMMNKGLELIEAHHLFAMPADRLDVVIHPQSVIHSMVEYCDGSVLAQLGSPDMRIPIAHTLAWPERMDTPCRRLDLIKMARLDFEAPDFERFPALRIAREAMMTGGAAPAILNAANEIAVAAFLARQIGFMEIPAIVANVLERYQPAAPASIADVLEIDAAARAEASSQMKKVAA